MARQIITPAGGVILYAKRVAGIMYEIVTEQGETVGYMRRVLHSRWAIALTEDEEFKGTYADMPHAAQGILFRRREDAERF
ncbi:hypothetical protein CcrColossus_gp367 [Caulobacter phage CcrColossus]|uniref:Uncharacterized protein n=1 Tax=Caulobacter phage CcrColossus TaxID=1211640 RepID=K4K6N0_9CAUD|nr:hypothetical protein CcrColossus_gp367 [Caulobacter phage CcrColossus]AFU88237.1 hypothetical protein CcrColossus_gp367 [Caulobacter phage CcrColossus]